MATTAPGRHERQTRSDGDDLRESELTDRKGAGLRQRIVIGVVIAMAIFWVYVLFIAPSAPEDKLGDPAFARAAQPLCTAAVDDLRTANLLNQPASSPAQRAGLVERTDARLAIMVQQLRGITPAAGDDRSAVSAWLDDWDQWLRDRATWVGKLRAGQDVSFDEKARSNGEPNSKALNAFAITNEMAACATPFGV